MPAGLRRLQPVLRSVTTLELLVVVRQAGVWGSLAPMMIGAWRLAHRPSGQRAVWMWMTVGVAINLWMMISGLQTGRNPDLAELGRAAFAIAGFYAIGELIESSRLRTVVYSGIGLFLVVWVLRVLAHDFANDFGPYNGPLLYLLLTLAAGALIWDHPRHQEGREFRSFPVLIAVGTIVSYAPGIALEPLSYLLYDTHREWLRFLWIIRGTLLLIGLAFFSLAFLWTIPRRSSSGSLPSVG